MKNNQVKTVEVDDSNELNIWLENNPRWVPFTIMKKPDSDRLFDKNYIVWLRYESR